VSEGFRFCLIRSGVVVRECRAGDAREAAGILKPQRDDYVTSALSYEAGWPKGIHLRVHLCALCVKPFDPATGDTMHPRCRERHNRGTAAKRERRREYWRDAKRREKQGLAVKAARARRLARGEYP
jgi:hypothetical protein